MIVSVDTNILIQAAISNGFSRKVLMYVSENYELVLSESVICEYHNVISRDYIINNYNPIAILNSINYRIVRTPKKVKINRFYIRDLKDYTILYTLINSNTDILITNDKDFENVDVKKPIIMTVETFSKEFMQ